MKIEVRYFAFFRQQIGRTSDEINLPSPATVADLLNSLRTIYPEVKDALNTAQISVNMEFVTLDTPLSARDEVALIPPVSGGKADPVSILTGIRNRVGSGIDVIFQPGCNDALCINNSDTRWAIQQAANASGYVCF